MIFINKKILIIFIIISLNVSTKINANTIIFKLNNIIYTSEDLERRINYVRLKNGTSDVSKTKIKTEYINALIFNEFGNKKIKIEESLIKNYYDEFFKRYQNIGKDDQLFKDYSSITKIEILDNLKIDIIRKIILEDLLNNNYKDKKKILEEVTIDDIYEKFFKYFSFNEENFFLVKKNNIKIDFNKIKNTTNELNDNNIKYIYENRKIIKIEDAIDELQKSFSKSDEFIELTIENNKIIGQLIKKIKFEKEIKYNVIKLELETKNLDYKNLSCEEILNDKNFNYNEINNIEFSSLNNIVKENLKKINDKIVVNESNKKFIIILCKITYDENFFKNYKINTQVNLLVNDMEGEFINKYSAIYNLEINNE